MKDKKRIIFIKFDKKKFKVSYVSHIINFYLSLTSNLNGAKCNYLNSLVR